MTENTSRSPAVHRWYTRPVFFVADVNRAARFYVETLGFEKGWHEGDGAGKVCQVNHGECEIILCEDVTRRDRARLFIKLTAEGLAALRREFSARAASIKESWWGYDTLQVDDPEGNELLFPSSRLSNTVGVEKMPLGSAYVGTENQTHGSQCRELHRCYCERGATE